MSSECSDMLFLSECGVTKCEICCSICTMLPPPTATAAFMVQGRTRTHVDSLNAFTVTVSVASRARLHSFELSTDGVLLPSLPSLPPCNYEGQTAYIHLHCGRPRHAMVDRQGARVKVTNRPSRSTIMQAQVMFVRQSYVERCVK